MRVDVRPRKRNAPRPAEKVAHGYSQWLRGRPCACEGRNPNCWGKIQAAHAPHKASKGTATKAADRYQLPLSEGCHLRTQHTLGWPSFARFYLKGRDPVELAEAYWRAWPGRIAWERKLADNG